MAADAGRSSCGSSRGAWRVAGAAWCSRSRSGLVAVALAFAVPQSRGARSCASSISAASPWSGSQRCLPAEERPLAAGLGAPVSRAEAEAVLGRAGGACHRRPGEPQLYRADGVVSALLATPEPVLLSELRRVTAGRC